MNALKNITRRIPARLWTTTLVVEAFSGSLGYYGVIRKLKRIGAIRNADIKPMTVNPRVIRDHIPTIYHRCVELILERRLLRQR